MPSVVNKALSIKLSNLNVIFFYFLTNNVAYLFTRIIKSLLAFSYLKLLCTQLA